jgi:hypothetical protein
LLVKFMPGRQQGPVLPGMALRGRYVFDAAVTVFVVVPMDEARGPVSGRVQVRETFDGEFRPVFGGPEDRLGVRIVVADARAGVRWFDAQPVR